MKIIQKLLQLAIEKNASDIHLQDHRCPLFRIDGELHEIDEITTIIQDIESEVILLLSEQQIALFKQKLAVDFAFDVENTHRIRGNMFKYNLGIAVTFRVISQDIPSLEELGITEDFDKIINFTNGLVLVTGATGSGKSTTLAALLNKINNTQRKHIITIEDPIEYIHQRKLALITQKQIRSDTPCCNTALEAALREDPDIIMIGEMREVETIKLALTAAETGHLVFATMHTMSAADSIDRLIYAFPSGERSMICSILASALRAVISQQLIKKKDKGRIAARELMFVTTGIANLIREHKVSQIPSSIQTGRLCGMRTLKQDMQRLTDEGKIAIIENLFLEDDQ